jgi:hypothetical protein
MNANTRNNVTGCCGSPAAASAAVTCGTGKMNPMTLWPARPRFFAGQLLTEDDLQSLSEYVVAKNRLHNRHLFGDGVVCGLEVTCHPCGGGTVIVQPGYALDCCGNDLVLPCPQPLDINAMVRDLRIKMLGYDCGDPCKEQKICCNEGDKGARSEEQGGGKCNEEPPRHYCLYIQYDEQMTDPVAPYSTDEPCGAQACQATRIREGVRFELRCREKEKPPIDLFSRICCCLGDTTSLHKSLLESRWLDDYSRRFDRAAERIKGGNVTKNDGNVELASKMLTDALEALATEMKAGTGVTEEKSVEFSAAALSLGTVLSYLYLYDRPGWDKHAGPGREVFNQAAGFFSTPENKETLQFPTVLEKMQLAAVFNSGSTITQSSPQGNIVRVAEMNVSETGSPAVPPVPADIQLLAEGVASSAELQHQAVLSLDALREWLLDRLDSSPKLTDCELRTAVMTVILPAPVAAVNLSGGPALRAAAEPLFRYFWRYLVDCICSAVNPVCQPCDDTGVLLACLEVKDCQVVRICNMERSFVLSPMALRYWMPPLHQLGETLEQFCCGCHDKEDENYPRSLIPLVQILSLICQKEPRVYQAVSKAVLAEMITGSVSEEGNPRLRKLVEELMKSKKPR